MNSLVIIFLLALFYSIFTVFLEFYFIGIEKKIITEIKRIEREKKIKELQKKVNDPNIDEKEKEKYMKELVNLTNEMFEEFSEMFFDINRLKIMFFGSILFMVIIFVILPNIKDKAVLTLPILGISLDPFWSFIILYFIFTLIQNIILSYWVRKYGKTFIKMEEKS